MLLETDILTKSFFIFIYCVFVSVDPNPCKDGGGCAALCLLSPSKDKYTCACPENFILKEDKKTCVSNCSSAQFLCQNTYKCIPFWWKCDTQVCV